MFLKNTIKSKQDPCAKFKGKDLGRTIRIDNVKLQRLKKGSFYRTPIEKLRPHLTYFDYFLYFKYSLLLTFSIQVTTSPSISS